MKTLFTKKPLSTNNLKDEHQICVVSSIVDAYVMTTEKLCDSIVEECRGWTNTSEFEMNIKFQYLESIGNRIRKEDTYFIKHKKKMSTKNNRYNKFCADIVCYECLKHALTNDPIELTPMDMYQKIDSLLEQNICSAYLNEVA